MKKSIALCVTGRCFLRVRTELFGYGLSQGVYGAELSGYVYGYRITEGRLHYERSYKKGL